MGPNLISRFAADLDALLPRDERLGLAVSGGPDSLALLLLATAARPRQVEAATVDHGLRPESRAEAEMVARHCERLGVPHAILSIGWPEPPRTAVQERAREERYAALRQWLGERSLNALATAHHLDDQAETLVMRLNRGSGVRGLAAMRGSAPLPGAPDRLLLRPLLGWRRAELEEVCAAAEIEAVDDPSNRDQAYERVRVRKAIAGADWLDPEALARSAANLAAADEALDWAAGEEWRQKVEQHADEIRYRPAGAPAEIRRRIVERAIARLAAEGPEDRLRGREVDRLLSQLEANATATLRGVLCSGGSEWTFTRAPPRRRPTNAEDR